MIATPLCHAGINDALESQQETMGDEHATLKSNAPDLDEGPRHRSRWSITNMTMWLGPAVNNLDGHLNPSGSGSGGGGGGSATPAANRQSRRNGGGGHGGSGNHHQNDQTPGLGDTTGNGISSQTGGSPAPYSPGSSLRNQTTVGYHINDTYTVGPVVSLSEKLYGSHQNVLFEDPQMRFTISDIVHERLGRNVLRANLWFSASAPVSDQSVANHNITSLRTSFTPRLQLAHSNFSFSGSSSAQVSLVENEGSFMNMLMPSRFFAGIQTAYKISRPLTSYIMTYASQTAGPTVPIQTDDPTIEAVRAGGNGKKYGLMTGLMIKPASWFSVSPRANWNYGQPLDTTTVGMNASFTLL